MQLYWSNTDSNDLWNDTNNWFEDAAATIAHNALPASGDSCSYATGQTDTVIIDNTAAVDLGSGTCSLTVANDSAAGGSGTINSGTFTADNFLNAVPGGVGGGINGGTFTGNGFINAAAQDPSTGTSGIINGGTFTGLNFTNTATFSNDNTVSGTIAGGTYAPIGSLAYSAIISQGKQVWPQPVVSGTADPGFANGGGTYAPNIVVTGVPKGGGGGPSGAFQQVFT